MVTELTRKRDEKFVSVKNNHQALRLEAKEKLLKESAHQNKQQIGPDEVLDIKNKVENSGNSIDCAASDITQKQVSEINSGTQQISVSELTKRNGKQSGQSCMGAFCSFLGNCLTCFKNNDTQDNF